MPAGEAVVFRRSLVDFLALLSFLLLESHKTPEDVSYSWGQRECGIGGETAKRKEADWSKKGQKT
ncbi:hypothetical protein RUM43_012323, partial [Polyplax serrata]